MDYNDNNNNSATIDNKEKIDFERCVLLSIENKGISIYLYLIGGNMASMFQIQQDNKLMTFLR